ncbi:hypothetical protein P7K49_010899 [Saguinus oedipus]|uniref:Uncharacterized protein n=1 Tax=Saguinus oedipus TaxID=9490 RepID=A0ABQ9VP39_SAGOE|nr:hypothetical protein P7K49_010899 [Saguinus oedipus]
MDWWGHCLPSYQAALLLWTQTFGVGRTSTVMLQPGGFQLPPPVAGVMTLRVLPAPPGLSHDSLTDISHISSLEDPRIFQGELEQEDRSPGVQAWL